MTGPTSPTSPGDFLRLAVDPIRLAVLGAAVVGPVSASALADELGVPAVDVLRAIGKLREAGVLMDDLSLDRHELRRLGTELPGDEPVAANIVEGWTEEETEILGRFFSGGRLQQLPGVHGKRLVVLERIAQEFDPGVRSPEKQVNFMLQMFYADYAALRRCLVDDGFLTRADGVYWRTGGRV